MIYLQLFLEFLKVGAVSFGGGVGMLSIIRDTVLQYGWLSEAEFLNFVAVAESTPGPIAVNIATFIGSSQAGVLGSLIATLGVILPSFIIILIIASLIKNLLKYAGVQAVLTGIRPAIIALILATAITMILSSVFGITTIKNNVTFDVRNVVIFVVIALVATLYKFLRKKSISPILLILTSACLGMLMYSIF